MPEAIGTLRDKLIPYSTVITPNLPEASLLLGATVEHQDQFGDAVRALSRLGHGQSRGISVLLKAGHLEGSDTLIDYFYDASTDRVTRLPTTRIDTVNTHGTGCTLSSAIAAFLAKGYTLTEAAIGAHSYLAKAIEAGLPTA